MVDWGQGASSINYLQVAANTRLVARMLAAMLRKFMQIGAQPSTFHLIGVSLGAHIAGYVGSEIEGIGRITGMLRKSTCSHCVGRPLLLLLLLFVLLLLL